MDPEVNLSWVATFCAGYSGADLKALLFNAQMEAYDDFRREDGHSNVVSATATMAPKKESVLIIEPKHLDKALIQTKASVTEKEARMYDQVYSEFLSGRKTNLMNSEDSSYDGLKSIFDRKGQRQTLA